MQKNSLSKHAEEPLLKLCYLTLLALSGEEAKEISYHSLSKRFFIEGKTARRIIAILENFVSEDINENIAIEGSSYNDIRRNPHADAFYLPALRLTHRETNALINALISTGLENNDAIISKLQKFAPKDTDINEIFRQNYTADHTTHHQVSPWMIVVCCLSKNRFEFLYNKNDGQVQKYTVDPLYVIYQEDRWYMSAWDTDADMQKYFVLSKMSNLKQAGQKAFDHDYTYVNSFIFEGDTHAKVTFEKIDYYNIIGHSAFKDIDYNTKKKNVEVTVNTTNPEWIAKQIAAGGGLVHTDNELVNKEAVRYAHELIKKAKSV